jgi:hypothetical protein
MCSHCDGVRDAQILRKVFQVEPPVESHRGFPPRPPPPPPSRERLGGWSGTGPGSAARPVWVDTPLGDRPQDLLQHQLRLQRDGVAELHHAHDEPGEPRSVQARSHAPGRKAHGRHPARAPVRQVAEGTCGKVGGVHATVPGAPADHIAGSRTRHEEAAGDTTTKKEGVTLECLPEAGLQ